MWSKYKDDVYQCIIVAIGCAIFGVGIDALVVLVLYSTTLQDFPSAHGM